MRNSQTQQTLDLDIDQTLCHKEVSHRMNNAIAGKAWGASEGQVTLPG
jgi:hypothetical protein